MAAMEPESNRQVRDHFSLDLNQMLVEEDDPKHRVFLVFMVSINTSMSTLVTNFTTDMRTMTEALKAISETQQKHLLEYERDKAARDKKDNEGEGVKKLLKWLSPMLQAATLGVLGVVWQAYGALKDADMLLSKACAESAATVKTMQQEQVQQVKRLAALEELSPEVLRRVTLKER